MVRKEQITHQCAFKKNVNPFIWHPALQLSVSCQELRLLLMNVELIYLKDNFYTSFMMLLRVRMRHWSMDSVQLFPHFILT